MMSDQRHGEPHRNAIPQKHQEVRLQLAPPPPQLPTTTRLFCRGMRETWREGTSPFRGGIARSFTLWKALASALLQQL